uniref:SLIT-ROBO Rho GTPase-activating protein 1 n=1 Tax=Globodera rostochiensis TaxID=31243 RepID=A0A914I8C0_GLORO
MASFRKASQQEFQHQIKEIRAQLFDQVKCLEQRTDVQVAILGEVNDFVKKKAELDLEYSKQLDKLVKSVMLKHKNEKLKRSNWALHSTCQLWQQLVDDAKEEARQRSITADVCANYVAPAVAQRSVALQKIAKKCREIGVLAQSEVVRVLHELHTAMKTYQHCFAQFNALSGQLQQAEVQRNKVGPNSSTRKQRSVQKSYDKKSEKYTSARLKCTRARNEYLLCIDAANASLHKFFADDISDLVDCSDLGMDWWLSLLLQNMITARKSACQVEMNALANLGSFKESLQLAADKQRFFESNHQTFMLPKRFDFRCEEAEHVGHISVAEGSLAEEFRQRHHQIRKRLDTLKAETEMGWQSMESAERQIRDLLSACTVVQVSEFGIATSADDDRRPSETVESELAKAYDAYMQTFSYYLYTANLVMRLEARADGIGNALNSAGPPADDRQQHSSPSRLTVGGSSLSSATGQISESLKNSGGGGGLTSVASSSITIQEQTELSERTDSLEWAQRYRKKRIGSQASTELTHPLPSATGSGGVTNTTPLWRRPRLFGGSLEEYTELTGEPIPLVVVSCIRILSQHALHHQGIFRISGSQLEINHMREAFESGEDPLRDVRDGNDANSIAGVLKLYLRELREPLFPFYLFDLLTDCAKCSSTVDFVNKICPLLNKLPRATYLLLRYLFAFLNHLSELSDENMMDPYNLAICFGPTLLPIPEGKDQVCYQNSVNEVVKNLIVHSDAIFNARVPGPRYEKYALEATDGGGTPAGDISAELELFVDDEVSSASVAVVAQPTPLDNWTPSTRQQQLHKRLSSADLPFPPPSPQFHRFHPQLQSPASASPPQQQQHYQRLPFLANHHNQQKQHQQVITETSSGGVVGQRDNSSSGANATTPSLMDWSLCSAASSVGGLPLPPVLCPTAVADVHYHQQQQNHQRKFLTTTNGNINNYCYSSSESGIADSTNGTATSPRPAVQQQQLVRQRMCGAGSGPNSSVDTITDNVADLYTSIHKGDHHRFPRHAMPTTASSVTTSTSSATTATQPSTVQCVRQQQQQQQQQSNVVGAVQQHQHKSPPVILRFGSAQPVPGEHRAHHHPPYPKEQQQQQQSGVSPPPYTALYGTKMMATAGRSPPITTSALHDGPSKSAAISPLTTAICDPSPTRRRNSFHDNMNSAAIAATSVSVVQSQRRAPLMMDKPSSKLTPTGQSAATDQLKQHRLEQVNAIDELLGKLSTVTGGGGADGDH